MKVKLFVVSLLLVALCSGFLFANGQGEAAKESPKKVTVLKYAHMNTDENTSGQMAIFIGKRIEELTNGSVVVEIYPNSQLGSLVEQAEMVSANTVQMHHDTWGNMGNLLEELEAFDTPYLAKSPQDYIKLNSIDSPLMKKANEKLIAAADVRILGSVYGGSRNLTCNFPIYSPKDLKGVKIRAIPAPVYVTAVEGMGAIAVPVDWVDVPAALSTGVVDGQENPPATINAARLQDLQKYMMDTKHIAAIGPFMINETAFQALSASEQAAVLQASAEAVEKFNKMGVEGENAMIQKLINDGMTFITKADGLDVDAFKAGVDAKVAVKFAKYSNFYAEVKDYLGY